MFLAVILTIYVRYTIGHCFPIAMINRMTHLWVDEDNLCKEVNTHKGRIYASVNGILWAPYMLMPGQSRLRVGTTTLIGDLPS